MLDLAFAPSSVAIIGASTNPAKFGYKVVEYLQKGGFTGRIYAINPKAEQICGLPAFRSLSDVPGPVGASTPGSRWVGCPAPG